MSKRTRKVAFDEEVDLAEKRRREEELYDLEQEEKRECALIRVTTVYSPRWVTESRFKAKHSLDSDEEDEPDPVQESGLGDEDLAAQEDTTIVNSSCIPPKQTLDCAECDVFALFSKC